MLALDQELALVLLSRPKALEIKELLAAQLSKLLAAVQPSLIK